MLMMLGESFRRIARLYAERHPDRQHHSYKVFKRLVQRIRLTESVQPNPSHRNERIRRPMKDERIEAVVATINLNSQDSTRRLSIDAGMGHVTVWYYLKKAKMHPYYLVLRQALQENDF